MRIDGKGFLVLLGVGTLALAVLTVWLWPRLAGSGARQLTGRIGLLLGTQLSLVATFLFTVNALGGFYTSWGQLFGTASAKYTVVDRGQPDAAKDDAQSLAGLLDPGAPTRGHGGHGGGVEGGGSVGTGTGTGGGGGLGFGSSDGSTPPYATAELTGLRSGLTADLQIYPPTDYTSRADDRRRYPVEVVDLTGGTTGLSGAAYHQIADTYQVMVVVVADPAGSGGSAGSAGSTDSAASTRSAGSAGSTAAVSAPASATASGSASSLAIPGVNVPHGAQGQLFWAQDLQAALRAHYRLDASAPAWGVAGLGQDGTAAVNLAVQDPADYGLAAAGGDWTHTAAQQSWPGIQTYLASVPLPDVSLLYDPTTGGVPAKLQASSGALRISRRAPLTLAEELDWLGASLDANTDVRA